jgi:hypothetical protein
MPIGRSRGDEASAVRDQDIGQPGQHHVVSPAAIATTPQCRQGPRHKHSHSPPSEISSSPSDGNRGIA